jgi:hypothetical protein
MAQLSVTGVDPGLDRIEMEIIPLMRGIPVRGVSSDCYFFLFHPADFRSSGHRARVPI